MIEQFYDLSRPLLDADERALALCREQFARLEEIKEYNQLKMLKAFTDCRVGGSHLVGTTGYGMDDAGRGKLEEVFAVLTGSEAALFRHNFMSGTHTLSVALFGVLRPGDRMVAVTGRPYDTLAGVIGIDGTHYGNLMEFGVQYDEVDLLADGTPDSLSHNLSSDHRLIVRIEGLEKDVLANIKTLKDLVEVVSYGEKEANVCEYSIEGKPGRDLRRDLFALCSRKGMPILALRNTDLSLEDVFLRLTSESYSGPAIQPEEKAAAREAVEAAEAAPQENSEEGGDEE